MQTPRKALLTFTAMLGGAALAIGTLAHIVEERHSARSAPALVSFNDGSADCSIITLSPYADRDTIGAALRDGALFVEDAGCINFNFDASQPANVHGVALAKDAQP